MLERYKAEHGYLYTGARLRNVPWIFAYSRSDSSFAHRVSKNLELANAIKTHVPEAAINEGGRLFTSAPAGIRGAYLDLR